MRHLFLNVTRADPGRLLRPALLLAALLWPLAELAAQPSGLFSSSRPRFLEVDSAFRLYTSLDSESQISIQWDIAPEYYLYADKLSARILAPAEVAGTFDLSLPEGREHQDEFFGDVVVYYQHLRIALALPAGTPQSFSLEVGYQGCAEAGLCYPPQLRVLEIYR
jgi:thioredoxin:protein disulfide reductase